MTQNAEESINKNQNISGEFGDIVSTPENPGIADNAVITENSAVTPKVTENSSKTPKKSEKKPKKPIPKWLKVPMKILITLFGFAFFVSLIINFIVYLSAKKQILTIEEAAALEDVDCILILGCGVRHNTTPSPMLSDRLTVGIRAYNAGVSDRVLMSGDHVEKYYNEVGVMKKVATEAGIDPDVIFMDHAGLSTYESMYRAKEIFGAGKIVIITQGYHLYRAVYDARNMGIDAYGITVDERTYINQPYYSAREFAARVKDYIYGLVKPLPTYLGEKIDLRGSASQTDG